MNAPFTVTTTPPHGPAVCRLPTSKASGERLAVPAGPSEKDRRRNAPTAGNQNPKAARKEARLSAALRSNLAKRKDQARPPAGGGEPTDQKPPNTRHHSPPSP